jgi:glucose-6-phosphate isomerase
MKGDAADDPYRNFPGNRPSSAVLLERLDPRTLGALVAFYEHRTFTNAVLLGIDAFDQFGVELGKRLARAAGEPESRDQFDASTRSLIDRAGL